MEIDNNIVLGLVTGAGALLTYIIRTLLNDYRTAIDKNTDALTALKIEIEHYHATKTP